MKWLFFKFEEKEVISFHLEIFVFCFSTITINRYPYWTAVIQFKFKLLFHLIIDQFKIAHGFLSYKKKKSHRQMLHNLQNTKDFTRVQHSVNFLLFPDFFLPFLKGSHISLKRSLRGIFQRAFSLKQFFWCNYSIMLTSNWILNKITDNNFFT